MARRVWQASGHEEVFTDPLVDCTNCKGRFRADLVEEMSGAPDICPNCGEPGKEVGYFEPGGQEGEEA